MVLQTFEELCDSMEICNYCSDTDYGERAAYVTGSGTYVSCEGRFCEQAYDSYLDANETTENIVKYASRVKLVNKEIFDGKQT